MIKKRLKKTSVVSIGVILIVFIISVINPIAVTATSVDDTGVNIDNTNGQCVLGSITNMLRRRAVVDRNENYSTITYSKVASKSMNSWDTTDYVDDANGLNMSVSYKSLNSQSGAARLSTIKSFLDARPNGEGITLYVYVKGGWEHAVTAVSYSGDTIYCVDPANVSRGRIALTSTAINNSKHANGKSQEEILADYRVTMWYISAHNNTATVTDRQAPSVSNVRVERTSGTNYTVYCDATDNVGVTSVKFPTWTAYNGQDDITWGEGTYVSGNTWKYTVTYSDHNYEMGDYYTHIYAYDAAGNNNGGTIATTQFIDYAPPKISDLKIVNVTSQGYKIQCTVTDNYQLNDIRLETYSSSNGSSNIVTQTRNLSGTSATVTFDVKKSDFNNCFGEYGNYIYVHDLYNIGSDRIFCDVSRTMEPKAIGYYGDSKYFVYNENFTWEEADSLAKSMGGQLASINSPQENTYITKLISGLYPEQYAIGLYKDGDSWKWQDGTSVSYTKWRQNQPDNSGGVEKYGEINSEGSWNDWSGTNISEIGAIIEIKTDDAHNSNPVATATYNGHTYELWDKAVSWTSAQALCRARGGYLATITSADENNVVRNLVTKGGKSWYFLGGTDASTEGTWTWVTGESFDANAYASFWNSGEPNNSNDEDRLCVDRSGGWNDIYDYDLTIGYVLERESDPASTYVKTATYGDSTYYLFNLCDHGDGGKG